MLSMSEDPEDPTSDAECYFTLQKLIRDGNEKRTGLN